MLHEINAATGEENWAFIPPNIMQGRLKSLKFDENNNLYDSHFTNGRRSLSIFLLDGKLSTGVIHKGTTNEKRILIGTLGRGGQGIYAMDITNPNNPQFLWAIENRWYTNGQYDPTPESEKIPFRWGSAVNIENHIYYEYLGSVLQEVPICQLADVANTGDSAYVALIPSGLPFSAMRGRESFPSSVFVINPENGEVYSFIEEFSGMIVAPLTLITSHFDSEKLSGFFRVHGGIGVVTYSEPLDGTGENWVHNYSSEWPVYNQYEYSVLRIRSADGESAQDWIVANKGVLAVRDNIATYLIGGSGNLEGANRYQDANNVMTNSQQYIFSLKLSTPFVFNPRMHNALTKVALTTISNETAGIPTIGDNGWYLELHSDDDTYKAEEMSTEPYLYDGHDDMVCISTFAATNDDLNTKLAGLACPLPPTGIARIYFVDPATAKAQMDVLELPDVKVTSMTGIANKLIVTLQTFIPNAVDFLTDPRVYKLNDSTIVIDLPERESVAVSTFGLPYSEFTRTINYAN